MKKLLALLLALCMIFAFAACGGNNNDPTKAPTEAPTDPTDPTDPPVVAMTYAEFMAAEVDAPVVIEATIQAAQKWNSEYSNTTLYTQDEDGAYFIYRLACTEAEHATLTAGTKIRVTGYKGEWSGEVEIVNATYEIIEDSNAYIAEAKDLTDKLGTEDLINYQNQFASFKGLTVEKIEYKNGEPGDDIYLTVSLNGEEYNFCVESDLTGTDSAVYQTVGNLKAGDVIDVEGFVYWYEGVNTHITSVTVK